MTLRNRFLEIIKRGKHSLTIFLANGVKLQGHIHSFDDSTVAFEREGAVQLIERHAISTYMPNEGDAVLKALNDEENLPF